MMKIRYPLGIAALVLIAGSSGAPSAWAAPVLGASLASFAVLGAAGVTNVPTSTIGGNLGSAPNASVGGGYVFSSGSIQQNTALAQNAQLELDTAIFVLDGLAPSGTLGADLTGTINPGVWDVAAGITNLSGNLILDGLGNSNAVWVFRFASTLITSSTSNVSVINVGNGANVGLYWNVRSAATLNGITFAGNVLAHDLISSDGNLTMGCGRLLSATTQVTLIKDTISLGCTTGIDATDVTGAGSQVASSGGFDQGVNIGSGGTGGSGGLVVNGVPEPATLLLAGLGMAGAWVARKRVSIPCRARELVR